MTSRGTGPKREGRAGPAVDAIDHRLIDPRAVRVSASDARADTPNPVVLEPPAVPPAPATHLGGRGVLGGMAPAPEGGDPGGASSSTTAGEEPALLLVDGEPRRVGLRRIDPVRAVLVEGDPDLPRVEVLILEPPVAQPGAGAGTVRREVVVEGWRVEVEIESERRASLRERARRGSAVSHGGGPTEVRAIIPGRIVSVSVSPGDEVVAGQQLLVVEAMKMQNELRAPRDGTIDSVAVAPGATIEVRDLLLVLR